MKYQPIFFVFIFILLAACKQDEPTKAIPIELAPTKTVGNYDAEKEDLATSVGTQAYLFGASIMTQHLFRNKMKGMIKVSKDPKNALKFSAAADDGLHFNELTHTLNLTTHEMNIGGTPNVDTRYSIIFFNLEKGAQVLEVPAIKNRYYSVNITDAYLGNRPYICSRKGDVNGGKYLFTGPDWKGKLPIGMKEIKMPQNNFLVVVRIYVQNRTTDNDKVTLIQNQFKLSSLDKFQGKIDKEPLYPVAAIPMPKGLNYFQKMTEFMQANPPEGHQIFIWNMFEQVGMFRDKPFDTENLHPSIKKGLLVGMEKGKAIIKWRAAERGTATNSGWHYSLGMGIEHDNYMFRSEWAVQGLTVGSAVEAIFFNIYKDSKGVEFDGSNKYTITLRKDQLPPVKDFWSITSYNKKFNVVPNKDYHYGVGDRNPDMKYNDDGSITFHVQSESPVEGMDNWIPTPKEGPFKLTFRFYNPKEVLFDKEKVNEYLPAVKKVDLSN